MSIRRLGVITRRVIDQFRRDHRSLALLFVVPVVVAALLGWIVRDTETQPPAVVAWAGDAVIRGPLESALHDADAAGDVEYVAIAETEDAARSQVADERADVAILIPVGTAEAVAGGGTPTVTLVTSGIDPVADSSAVGTVVRVLVTAFAAEAGAVRPAVVHEPIHGSPDADQLDALGPIFIGFFAYFFVFVLTGVSFLRERIGGTLERLLATPVTRGEIILGYSVGFGLFAAVQVAILLAYSLAEIELPALGPVPPLLIGLGVANAGSPLLVFLVVLLLALGAVSLAILLSTFARTELQVIQFIPLVIVPQALLGGLLWSVESLPSELELLSRVMPVRYGIDGLRAVMVRGAGLGDAGLQADLLLLAGFMLLFVALATRTIRREVV